MGSKSKVEALGQWVVVAAVVVIGLLGGGARGIVLCNTDTTKLSLCRPTVTGQYPPLPTEACCAVVRHADLPCLCRYKSVLPALGINPKNAVALPNKCGVTTPPQCRGNHEIEAILISITSIFSSSFSLPLEEF